MRRFPSLACLAALTSVSGCSGELRTSLRLTVELEAALSIDQLRLELSLGSREPQFVPNTPQRLESGKKIVLLCPDEWAGKRLSVTVIGLSTGQERARAQTSAELVRAEMVERTVRLCAGSACAPTCQDECQEGARRCSGSAAYQICGRYGNDACLTWGTATSCIAGESCRSSDGRCFLDCGGKPCPCKPGETQGCPDQGECRGGKRQCIDGSFGSCEWTLVGPKPEVCDGKDNDCNGKIDETGCSVDTAESFACNDGVDNDGDGAIDCGDSNCTGRPACQNLADGKPCLNNNECAGGKCLTEADSGYPNGHCTNLYPCTLNSKTGCNGGYCTNFVDGTNRCVALCDSNILLMIFTCRAGYACAVPWNAVVGGIAFCVPACAKDAECSTKGPGRGCNPQSKLCGPLAAGLLPYGSACTASSQCESKYCAVGTRFPNGACIGLCTASIACGSGGVCFDDGDSFDSTSGCTQACTSSSTCRQSDGYQCRPTNFEGTKLGCLTCQAKNTPCSYSSQCCSKSCVGYSNGKYCD